MGKIKTMQKLIQRQVYDVLSHKYGLIIVLVGLFLCVISAFHFGEAVLEWSQEKYSDVFNSYRDNIAGKSFRNRLCAPLPIDVVYTWVNGSDPKLKAELRLYKSKLERLLNVTNVKEQTCQFSHCLPVSMVVVEPSLHGNITPSTLAALLPSFPLPASLFTVPYSTHNKDNFTILSFHTEKQVKTASNRTVSIYGRSYKISRAFITSDQSVVPGTPLRDRVIMSGFPHRYSAGELKDRFPRDYWSAITHVDLHQEEGLAVLHINNGTLRDAIVQANNNITIDGKSPTFSVPNLIWHLSPLLDDDATKLSRFEDNELLKYSIRSLEKHAPWVRNIYLVTNGQIPSWLNLENHRLILVSHQEIFPDHSHLPSFSSPAIESHLHRIPGLSRTFLYFNDDVLLGADVWPEDFYTHSRGHKVYLTWGVPNCQEGCPSTWIRDGYCDKACNNSRCEWDGGDCTGENANAFARFGGIIQPFHGQFAELTQCYSGCADNWLSDKYCDQTCNHVECAFDAGDCGTDNYHRLTSIPLDRNTTEYTLPPGITRMFFNLSTFISDSGVITDASYEHSKVVRTAAVSLKYRVLTLLLHPGYNRTRLTFGVAGSHTKGDNSNFTFHFALTVSTKSPSNATSVDITRQPVGRIIAGKSPPLKNQQDVTTEEPIVFADVPRRLRYPQTKTLHKDVQPSIPVSASLQLSPNARLQWEQLEDDFKRGDLTERGLQVQQQILLQETLNHSKLNLKQFLLKKQPHNSLDSSSAYTNRKLLSFPDPKPDVGNSKNYHKNLYDIENTPISKKMTRDRIQSAKSGLGYNTGLPWEKIGFFGEIEKKLYKNPYEIAFHSGRRRLLGVYEDSLLHVNRLYNTHFGFSTRKVPGHIAHYVDKTIMEELQAAFPAEWEITSSHHIRSSTDMQFSFAYFYYLMSVKVNVTLDDVFTIMDTDQSGVLSDREIRTLATQLFDSPLNLQSLTKLEGYFAACRNNTVVDVTGPRAVSREIYYMTTMPQVTRDLFTNCTKVTDLVRGKFQNKNKYKFEIENDQQISFKMLSSNVSVIVGQLDDIRRHPRKFICLNDNMDHTLNETRTAQAILTDFLESLYPAQSQFELERDYRNRFLHIDELREWHVYRNRLQFWAHVSLAVLIIVTLISFLSDKIEALIRRSSGRPRSSPEGSATPSTRIVDV